MDFDTSILPRLSSRVPRRAEKEKFSVFDLSQSLSEFLTENFRGLAEVKADINDLGYVMISAEHFAYLVKLILKQINGEMFLTFNISFDRKSLVMEIPFEKEIVLTLRERANLCATASGAGLDIEILPSGITLSAKSTARPAALFIYAGGIRKLRNTLIEIFFDR